MTTFDERERGYENKFAFDADLKFRAESRRNKAVAEWAGAKLGLTGEALEAYIKDVRKADLAEKGDNDVFRKVQGDLSGQRHQGRRSRDPRRHGRSARDSRQRNRIGETLKRRLV